MITGANPELQTRLRRMIDVREVRAVARELGVTREALARYLLGWQIRDATFALIESKLAAAPVERCDRCPHCNSPDRHFHRVTERQGGELARVCRHAWHGAASAETGAA